jgi:hypothetical protein
VRQRTIDFVYAIHHGLRVTFGHDGLAGVLLECKGQHGKFWRVKVGREWLRPERIVVASEGAHVRTCYECELEFRSDKANEVLCLQCERRMNAARAKDPGEPQQFERHRPIVRYGNAQEHP